MNSLDQYAKSVVAGEIPAGKYHRLACERHLRDRERENTPEFPYVFVDEKAEKFFRFAQKLKHYKGKWAGQPVELQPYQKFRLGSMFGWVRAQTGKRRFRNAYHELPRKQGKSLEAAIVTLYVTFFDGESGAEGYCAATKREQATIIFEDCKKLVMSSGLKQRLKVNVGSIYDERTSSKIIPLSADYNSMDGLNPNLVNIDEFHAHKTRGVVDVLETATGAREQPLINKITTAGDDPVSPCGDEHDYATKILERVLVDESYFAFIAHADLEHSEEYEYADALVGLVRWCSCDVKREFSDMQQTSHTESGADLVAGNGISRTRIGSERETKETTSVEGTQFSKENTEYPRKNTNDSTLSREANAESVKSSSTCLPWITATTRRKFAAYCADPVMRPSGFSEILKSEFKRHSTTCFVQKYGKIEGIKLILNHPSDDWTLQSTAAKANPNYGVSVNPEDLASKVTKAAGIPSAAATYKQKHLNLWVNATAPCLSVDGWAKGQSDWTWEEMLGEECWIGIDLAAKIDLCAMSIVFPPNAKRTSWRIAQRIWTPGDTIVERARRDRAPYPVWAEQGWLTEVEGTSINHHLIREALLEVRDMFKVQMIGLDPWHADQIIIDMVDDDGWTAEQVLEVPQNFASLTSAETRFKTETLAGNMDARRCPVTAWAVSNVAEQTDGKGNIQFSKKRSRGRIDPVKSATSAMSLYLRNPIPQEPEFEVLILGGRKV